MLPADTHFQIGPRCAPQSRRHLNEPADALAVEHLERVLRQDAPAHVLPQELGLGVVAAEGEGRLRQVVGAEAEKLRLLGDLVGREGCPGTSIIVPNL